MAGESRGLAVWAVDHITHLFIAGGIIVALALWLFSSGALPLRDGVYVCSSGNALLPVGATVKGDTVVSAESSEMMNATDPIVNWTTPKKNGTENFRMTVKQQSGRTASVDCTWKWES